MIVRLFLKLAGLSVVAGVVFGASPVATVSSSGSFAMRGVIVKSAGVPSWPVLSGDEIATSTSSATLSLRDGSRVTLEKGSTAKVENAGAGLTLRLSSGSMQVFARSSALQVYHDSVAVPVVPGEVINVSSQVQKNSVPGRYAPTSRTRPAPVSAH